MSSNREAARRKGLRMAAQLAAIGGFVAASAAAGMSSAETAGVHQAGVNETGASSAEELGDAIRVRDLPVLGCVKWGPPAPPEMRPELFAAMAEAV